MWYTGKKGPNDFFQRGDVGYATSGDGLTWTKHESNPILPMGSLGGILGKPFVLKHAGIYKMWYKSAASISYATSADGISWTAHPSNPVLTVGAEGEWDDGNVSPGTVHIVNDTTYRIWYVGRDLMGLNDPIGYAASSDGIHWTKFSGNPVFDVRPPEETRLRAPDVVFDGESYHMFYEGGDLDFLLVRLLYATSPNGFVWTRRQPSPLVQVGPFGSFDAGRVGHARVIFDGQTFKMWYTGRDNSRLGQIGFASAPIDNPTNVTPNDIAPATFELAQNHPNPFNPSTTIPFAIAQRATVKLTVFDILGREVAVLVDEALTPGAHEVVFDADGLASGVYVYRLRAGALVQTKKLMLLR